MLLAVQNLPILPVVIAIGRDFFNSESLIKFPEEKILLMCGYLEGISSDEDRKLTSAVVIDYSSSVPND